jgi:hypothetical protein
MAILREHLLGASSAKKFGNLCEWASKIHKCYILECTLIFKSIRANMLDKPLTTCIYILFFIMKETNFLSFS